MEVGENIVLNNELFGVALVEHMYELRQQEVSHKFLNLNLIIYQNF
jgi:hypothetical protein